MTQIVLFVVASAGIVWLSWRSLRDLSAHGFYRFFGFELLWALAVLNAPLCFSDLFSLRQVVSFFLGAISIGLAIEGFRLLRLVGQPGARPQAPGTNLPFENTTALVTVGAYQYIRHPLYASLLAATWCAWLKDPLGAGRIFLALGASGFFVATAIAEERENLAHFGAPYGAYMKTTSRFIPFLW